MIQFDNFGCIFFHGSKLNYIHFKNNASSLVHHIYVFPIHFDMFVKFMRNALRQRHK